MTDDDSDFGRYFFQTELFWEKLNGSLCANPLLLRVYPCRCGETRCLPRYPADYAIRYGNFATLKWIHSQGGKWTHLGFFFAVRRNRFNIVRWLWNHGGVFTSNVICEAIGWNNLRAVVFLFERFEEVQKRWNNVEEPIMNGFATVDRNSVICAAEYGFLRILRWLYENRWSSNRLEFAKTVLGYNMSNLNMIRWIHHAVPEVWLWLNIWHFDETYVSHPKRLSVVRYVKAHSEQFRLFSGAVWQYERILGQLRQCVCGRTARRAFFVHMLPLPCYFDMQIMDQK